MMKQRVLFIGTSFFSIQKEIMASLCKKGFDVDFFVMSRPRNILLDTVCRLSIKIEDGIQNKYYRIIILINMQIHNKNFPKNSHQKIPI